MMVMDCKCCCLVLCHSRRWSLCSLWHCKSPYALVRTLWTMVNSRFYLPGQTFKASWKKQQPLPLHRYSMLQGSALFFSLCTLQLIFSVYTTSLVHTNHSHTISYHCYKDTQLFLSFHCISLRLPDISAWMTETHLVSLFKTDLVRSSPTTN